MLSIQASTHQGNAIFKSARKQCMTNCITAMFLASNKQPAAWNKSDLDKTLQDGDDMHQSINIDKFLLVAELPKEISPFLMEIKLRKLTVEQ